MLSKFYYSANEFSKSEEKDWQVSKRSNALLTTYHPGTSVLNSFWYVLSQVETFLILAQNLLKTINLCCVTHLVGKCDLTCFTDFIRSPWNWALEFTHVISLFKVYRSRISRLNSMDCELFYGSSILIFICFKIQFWNKLNEFILAN